ncbi:MAG TPA: hypothetical protein PKM78_11085 [Anaerolineae bacterium]|nr:hypothetical protein [Anaerolineae bacterium]HNU04531.1 hypothetical protein [Anaerolineae bacterium]
MPVTPFAEFVAEQAIAIALGAAAVVAAPKAGPKLAEMGADVGARAKSMVNTTKSSEAAAEAAAPAGETDPASTGAATAAGPSLVEKLADGARKLGQQWSALFAEIAAENPASEVAPPSLASVLAGVGMSDVVSQAPGRVRLRLRMLVGQPQLAVQLGESLAAIEGIRQVQPNPTTGSVLITFDDRRYPTPEALLKAIATP